MANTTIFYDYSKRLRAILADYDWKPVERLARDLGACWDQQKQVFLCGNGGSAAFASHFIVDLTKNAGIRCINCNKSDLINMFF